MKKFQVLIALALLAVAGTGFAVTCAQDNVPGATLLVPFFKVSRNGSTGGDIPAGGTDTLVAVTNVSNVGLIAHVTVFNKYSKALVDFNVPMSAHDVASFFMRDILNGKLNVNGKLQPALDGYGDPYDVCGTLPGWGEESFIRFTNPTSTDHLNSISWYDVPAFSGSFRTSVWSQLDESADIVQTTTYGAKGSGIVDASGCVASDTLAGDFTGYLTIDVVNYCTNFFPYEESFYTKEAIATTGWAVGAGAPGSPNLLIGDIFFVDPSVAGGNISGDPVVSLEFDARLQWSDPSLATAAHQKTFYTRYWVVDTDTATYAPWAFEGDGREPLGRQYAFRYLWDGATTNPGLQTWAVVFRSDYYGTPRTTGESKTNLCDWWATAASSTAATAALAVNYGFDLNAGRPITVRIFDLDENEYSVSTGGPSGGASLPQKKIYLEAQRLVVTPNTNFIPVSGSGGEFGAGGWISIVFSGTKADNFTSQAWVGVQHSGAGLAVSVGHAATLINNQFTCLPNVPTGQFGNGNQGDR